MSQESIDVVEERLAAFIKMCRKVGLKATHQRAEIYRELARTDEHPDAETVFRRVRRRIPAISLDTVYRTLRLMEEKGTILRVVSLGDRTRFDANTEQHHHFVCRECGAVKDFDSEGLNDLRAPPEAAALGTVESFQVELRGICVPCRAKRRRVALGQNR